MTDDIVIVEAEPRHLGRVETWATHNEALHNLFMTPRHPSAGGRSQHWAALRGDEVVAIGTVERDGPHSSYLACVVKPSELRQDIGSQMVEYILAQPDVQHTARLKAAVDPTNTAAQKILQKNGFSRLGPNEFGQIEFARHSLGKKA